MDDAIIDPMWIYYADVFEGISELSCLLSLVSFIATLFYYVTYEPKWKMNEYYREEYANYKSKIRTFSIILAISTPLAIFVPNEKTLLQMYIASQITPKTIQQVGATAEDVATKTVKIITEGVVEIMKGAKEK